MRAVVRLCVLLVLLAVALPDLGAAPGPAPSLFPLVPGAAWTRKNEDGRESTSRVTGPKVVGTTRCTVVERKFVDERGRERVERTCYLVSAAEILVIETTNLRGELTVLKPPRALMKLPARAGQTWAWSPEDSAFDLKITSKWVGEESIKVPSGTFRAWKLQTVTAGEDFEVTVLTWYAPGVGAVRSERKGRRGDRQISGWSELISYKIP
ncbi:MAG: hypothetical protein HY355_05400 [Armatimonadetes bacterium]|nr:hypothetical protein [Armatimonadota bacterium]